jgi:CheY-like chemotaxis protein
MDMKASDKVNILLVDDQPAKLLSYEVILGGLGENLIKAGSAREALEHLLKTEIAVILVDVCMPETDGFELAAMIREHPRFKNIAIIFVSAIQVADPDRLRGYAAGAVDYVPVPVDPRHDRQPTKGLPAQVFPAAGSSVQPDHGRKRVGFQAGKNPDGKERARCRMVDVAGLPQIQKRSRGGGLSGSR